MSVTVPPLPVKPRVAVVLFPGSNCDHDAVHAVETAMDAEAWLVRHDSHELRKPDLVVLPGGFSYGDYLRAGAMARFSPVMDEVLQFAKDGGGVLGICNGFQVLCEAGVLPGALARNANLRFVCRDVHLRVETKRTPFTLGVNRGQVLRMPIAHGEGRWSAAPEVLEEMTAKDQVVFRYVLPDGKRAPAANPNGSMDDVAGICNEQGNVVGLMPHPERAAEDALGGADGAQLFRCFAQSMLAMGKRG